MRTLFALVLCLAAWPVLAHPETSAAEPQGSQIDCEHPPESAARALPDALAVFSGLGCNHLGHFMMAAPGWNWRFPGSYFIVPTIPAFTPAASMGQAGLRFFNALSVRELSADEARSRHQQFAGEIPTYSAAGAPRSMLQLTGSNDLGDVFEAYFPFESPDRGWALICDPHCAPEYVFRIDRLESSE
ncbi:MAG TPA: hypothetical protein VMP00_06805 [Burkholderiales bacterium]|nr:hypothetical protein [Burkholderiales bacterium]